MDIPLVRSNHPAAFRAGEWARIVSVVVTTVGVERKACLAVEFLDGTNDYWALGDPDGMYEFKP